MRSAFGHGEGPDLIPQALIRALQMDWDRIMDSASDAHLRKRADQFISLSGPNRVDMVDVPRVRGFIGSYDIF